MPFNYLLTNLLVDVPAAVGAIFVDSEGEAVDWVTRHDDPYDLKVEGAYHSIFKRQIEGLAEVLSGDQVDAFIVECNNLVALTQTLPDGYYVVLVLDKTSSRAQALYHLRRSASAIARELA
jgi:predicted regulator of Ras-like GTPase activity (Roadblock/LC7/MglB family)